MAHGAKGIENRSLSAKLFCKHSQVTFMSYRVVLKYERGTSNNDVAALHNLISFVFKHPMSNLESLILFLFFRYDTRNEILN